MKRLWTIVLNSFIALTAIFVTLVACELFLRWDSSFTPFDNPYSINKHDIRYEFQFVKNDLNSANPKVFVLGDSFVAGVACSRHGTNLTGHMKRLAADLGRKINFVNLGVSGKAPTNYVDFIDHFQISTGDAVILVLYDNDIYFTHESCRLSKLHKEKYGLYFPSTCDGFLAPPTAEVKTDQPSAKNLLREINNYLWQVKLAELARESLYNVPGMSRFYNRSRYRTIWNEFESEEVRLILSQIRHLEELARRTESRFFLTYYPNTNNIRNNDPRHDVWLKFLDFVQKETGLIALDPYPYLQKAAPSTKMVWSLTDKHPSCDAHRIVAEYFVQETDLLEHVERN